MIQFIKKYEKFEEILSIEDFEEFLGVEANLSKDLDKENVSFAAESQLSKIQEKFRKKWSTFNVKYCIFSIISFILSILSILSKLIQNSLPSIYSNSNNFRFLKDSGIIAILVLILGLLFRFSLPLNALLYLILFNITFLARNQNLSELGAFLTNDFLKPYEILVFICINLIPFSNSFIINESSSLRFFLISLLFVEAYARKSIKFVVLASLVRFTWVFYVCREEVASTCNQTIFSIQLEKLSSYSYNSYLLFLLFNFSIAILIYAYLAKIHLDTFLSRENILNLTNFALLFIYNLNQLRIYDQTKSHDLNGHSLYIARAISFLAAVVTLLSRSDNRNRQLFNSMIAFGIFMSLLNSQSFLSIWILILLLFELFLKDPGQVIIKGKDF